MIKIRNLIHLTHVIENNDKRREAEQFYLDVFAAQTFFDARPMPGLERDETLTLIGKTQVIPMAPVDDLGFWQGPQALCSGLYGYRAEGGEHARSQGPSGKQGTASDCRARLRARLRADPAPGKLQRTL